VGKIDRRGFLGWGGKKSVEEEAVGGVKYWRVEGKKRVCYLLLEKDWVNGWESSP